MRELHRLTQTQLGERVGVSQATLALVEKNQRTPGPDVAGAIADALDCTVGFFERPLVKAFEPGSLTYRARTRLRAVERSQAHQYAKLFVEQTQVMTESLQLPPLVGLPDAQDPETTATQTRFALGIHGHGPVPHLINALERHGIVVFRLPVAFETIHAFSTTVDIDGQRPIIILSAGLAGDRIRSNVAHELGHVVLHQNQDHAEVEREADAFASAFLLPAQLMYESVSAQLNLTMAGRLKSRWQVSMQMVIRRARDLGIIPERRYRSLFQQISARGWRKNEPGELVLERPRIYRQMAEVLYGDNLVSGLAADFNIRPALAGRMVGEYSVALGVGNRLHETQTYRTTLPSHVNN